MKGVELCKTIMVLFRLLGGCVRAIELFDARPQVYIFQENQYWGTCLIICHNLIDLVLILTFFGLFVSSIGQTAGFSTTTNTTTGFDVFGAPVAQPVQSIGLYVGCRWSCFSCCSQVCLWWVRGSCEYSSFWRVWNN